MYIVAKTINLYISFTNKTANKGSTTLNINIKFKFLY